MEKGEGGNIGVGTGEKNPYGSILMVFVVRKVKFDRVWEGLDELEERWRT